MDFTINRFKGSVPRLADHLGQKTGASLAIDCDFSSGCLDSFREPSPYRTVAEGTKATFQHECCWHDFKGCVDMAYGSVTCKQAFVTGAEDYPLVLTVSTDDEGNCVTKTRRLGLPCPHKKCLQVFIRCTLIVQDPGQMIHLLLQIFVHALEDRHITLKK